MSATSGSGHEDSLAVTALETLSATKLELTAARTQTASSVHDTSLLVADRALCSHYERILSCSFSPKPSDEPDKDIHPESERGYLQREKALEDSALEGKLLALRRLVISSGLPKTDFYYCGPTEARKSGRAPAVPRPAAPSLRSCVWKVLLGALVVDAPTYLALMKLGPCAADKKIRDDTFRTYKNNDLFWGVVTEGQLTRVLTATARVLTTHAHSSKKQNSAETGVAVASSGSGDGESAGYVQGMNVLLAPLLFVMPSELDAFACFSALLAKHCPRYIRANLEGVHAGCALAESCLQELDPELHAHLQKTFASQLHMEIFMFQFVLTLFANMSQLEDVLVVWDALFAFGVHFNCVLVATHIMLQRDVLLGETSAFRVQRAILQSPLDGELLVYCGTRLLSFVPPALRLAMLLHPVEGETEGGKGRAGATSSSKISASAGFRSGLLQKARSKSTSNLRSSNSNSRDREDTRHLSARISYLSASNVSSMKSASRPKSAGSRALSRSHISSSDGSSISVSRLLNPSLRIRETVGSDCNLTNGERNPSSTHSGDKALGRSSTSRPRSAPSSSSRKSKEPQAQTKAKQSRPQPVRSMVGGKGDGERPKGWVRSLRVGTTGGAVVALEGSTAGKEVLTRTKSPQRIQSKPIKNTSTNHHTNRVKAPSSPSAKAKGRAKTDVTPPSSATGELESSAGSTRQALRRFTSGITTGSRSRQPEK